MNPENIGEHIVLRHSSLWRNPLTYEKQVSTTKHCHQQLNEISQTGKSWRFRNNKILTHSNFTPKVRLTTEAFPRDLRQTLRDDDAQSDRTKVMLKTLKTQACSIERTPLLVKGLQNLKKMHLLVAKSLQKVSHQGNRSLAIINDYHGRKTNPGYSRGVLGRHYTR